MNLDLSVPDYGILSALTRELRRRTGLAFIHVVPAPVVGYESWTNAGGGNCDEFNANLGKAGAPIVWRALQRLLTIGAWREDPEFRIGVAGGQTTYGVVESLQQIITTMNVKVAPLVLGAVPRHRYSAGTIADIFSHRIEAPAQANGAFDRLDSIEVWKESRGQYQVSLRQDIELDRSSIDQKALENAREVTLGFFNFQYVLVGIGCYVSAAQDSNIAAHVEALYRKNPPPKLCGDICSRLFDAQGAEIDREKQDHFVSVSLKTLRLLVKLRRPVIAIAGGPEKVAAIHAVLRGHAAQPIINGLITDELTATELCRELARSEKDDRRTRTPTP